ncbi:MAG: class II glutamine amidotransferase [Alphaproteobacteria bacterium]|nr:MAG: class II glutamine amidotransferase [Alphaproteobacteria bacterium]
MCRWIAYSGQPIFIEQLITLPEHSLVEQSLHTEMNFRTDGSLMSTNGDGFGIGWYAERPEPGLYKDDRPAWSNNNLHALCRQIRARIFFAHVRATTTGAVQRANCHPFKYKNWLFQHNGDVTDFTKIRRDLQMDISPEFHRELKGTTDSETFFLLALTYGLQENPKKGLQKMVERVKKALVDNGIDGHLNLSCALSNGQTVYTLRYAHNAKSKTQFYSSKSGWVHDTSPDVSGAAYFAEDNIVVVSEPLDRYDNKWNEIPDNSFATIFQSEVTIEKFMD